MAPPRVRATKRANAPVPSVDQLARGIRQTASTTSLAKESAVRASRSVSRRSSLRAIHCGPKRMFRSHLIEDKPLGRGSPSRSLAGVVSQFAVQWCIPCVIEVWRTSSHSPARSGERCPVRPFARREPPSRVLRCPGAARAHRDGPARLALVPPRPAVIAESAHESAPAGRPRPMAPAPSNGNPMEQGTPARTIATGRAERASARRLDGALRERASCPGHAAGAGAVAPM